MGAISGIDSDVWVAALPSISLGGGFDLCSNIDGGLFLKYQAVVHKYWDRNQAIVVQVGTDAKQSVAITGGPTGGTFTLSFGGQTTAVLAIGSTAAQIQAALVALSTINAGNVSVTGVAGGPWTVEFTSVLGGAPQALLTSANTFTGGVSPNVVIASTQTGIAWVTVTNYTFIFVGGVITFANALAATQVVRISTGFYFNLSQCQDSSDWELNLKSTTVDTTVFQGGWGRFTGSILTGTGKIMGFRVDGGLQTSVLQLMVFSLYISKTQNARWECFGWITNIVPKSSVKGVVTQEIDFASDGQVYFYGS